MSHKDVMGKTKNMDGPIVYSGSNKELQQKLRNRDDRITELEESLTFVLEWCRGIPKVHDSYVLSPNDLEAFKSTISNILKD